MKKMNKIIVSFALGLMAGAFFFGTHNTPSEVEVLSIQDLTPPEAEGFEFGVAQCLIYLDITDPRLLRPGAHEIRIRGNQAKGGE